MPTNGESHMLRLKENRRRRGWTQHQAAEQLARVAWFRRGQHVGVNADMLSKWERGEKRPSNLYIELLCLMYETTSEHLGLEDPRRRGLLDERPAAPDGDDALAESLLGTTKVLEELGPSSQLLQPRIFAAWKDELVKRRTMLKLLSVAPTALAAQSLLPDTSTQTRGRPDVLARKLDVLDNLATQYQRLYHSAAPTHLMSPVVAHIETVADLLRGRPDPQERRRLLCNRSRVALLAGRLTFFDLHDPMGARSYYNLAQEAAREAKDHLLAAAALGHVSFIPAADGSYEAAQDYLRGANHHLGKHPHPVVESWAAAVEAEIQTNAGNEKGALAAVDRAESALPRTGGTNLPDWFDFYDRARCQGFKGYTSLTFGRTVDAVSALDDALSTLPAQAVKQRSVYQADLATVRVHEGEIDEGCRLANEAADCLAQAGYATATDRLRSFRGLMEPWKNHPGVKALDEHLALT